MKPILVQGALCRYAPGTDRETSTAAVLPPHERVHLPALTRLTLPWAWAMVAELVQSRRHFMRAARLAVPPVIILFAAALSIAGPASAQTGAASLTGIVTDQSGASVPGATVTALSQATNVAFTGVTV